MLRNKAMLKFDHKRKLQEREACLLGQEKLLQECNRLQADIERLDVEIQQLENEFDEITDQPVEGVQSFSVRSL